MKLALVNKGANLAVADKGGNTPLHTASLLLFEGDIVNARYRGGVLWHPGKIDAINDDGSYNIKYDDEGYEKAAVKAELIRRVGGTLQSKHKLVKALVEHGADLEAANNVSV